MALRGTIRVHQVVVYGINEAKILILLQLSIDVVDLEEAFPEPVGRLLELLVMTDERGLPITDRGVLHCQLEVKICEIVHGLDVAFVRSFLVQHKSFVVIFINAIAKLVADAQVVDGSSVSSIRRLLEPLGSLLVLSEIFEVQTSKGIHTFNMTICGSLVIVFDGLVEVLLENIVTELEVLASLEESLSRRLVLELALREGLAEVLISQFSVWLLIVAFWMDSFFQKLASLVNCIRFHVLRCRVIVDQCFVDVLFDANTLLKDPAKRHHGLGIVVARRLLIKLDRLCLVLSLNTDIKELAIGVEAISICLALQPLLLQDLLF